MAGLYQFSYNTALPSSQGKNTLHNTKWVGKTSNTAAPCIISTLKQHTSKWAGLSVMAGWIPSDQKLLCRNQYYPYAQQHIVLSIKRYQSTPCWDTVSSGTMDKYHATDIPAAVPNDCIPRHHPTRYITPTFSVLQWEHHFLPNIRKSFPPPKSTQSKWSRSIQYRDYPSHWWYTLYN